jgi:hypothetical protein
MAGNQKVPLREIIKQEYTECLKSPSYFMKKYCKIQHPTLGTIPFALYDFQAKTLESFRDEQFNIVLKARQMGISTLVSGYALWLMTFFTDKSILCIAINQETAKNIVTKVTHMSEHLPSWLRSECTEKNKLSMRFKNGSNIRAASSSVDASRSSSLSLLIVDECAFITNMEDIWTASQSTITTGGRSILLSTPNGIGNFFHKTWVGTMDGSNDFNPINLHWSLHPDRDQKWRDLQTKVLGEKDAAQECDCDFISSGRSVVDASLIEWYKSTMMKEPVEKRGANKEYWIWEYPNHNKDYVVAADVARGDGKDKSAFHVFDVENVRQVAEFKGEIETKDFGNLLVAVASEFNGALLVVENANIGWAVLQQIIDKGYNNLYYTQRDYQYIDEFTQHTNKLNRMEKKQVPGFTTSMKTRPLIISKMETYVREKELELVSERTIEELFTFVWNGQRAEAMQGYNDDLVISLCIALWVRDTALRFRSENIETQKSLFDYMGSTTNMDAGQAFLNSGLKSNPYEMKNPHGGSESLDWLLK